MRAPVRTCALQTRVNPSISRSAVHVWSIPCYASCSYHTTLPISRISKTLSEVNVPASALRRYPPPAPLLDNNLRQLHPKANKRKMLHIYMRTVWTRNETELCIRQSRDAKPLAAAAVGGRPTHAKSAGRQPSHLHILPAAVSPTENIGLPLGWSSFRPHGLTTT